MQRGMRMGRVSWVIGLTMMGWAGVLMGETIGRDLDRVLFGRQGVVAIEIRIPSEAVRGLEVEPRRDREAVVWVEGRELKGARVHLKGRGSFQGIHAKPSLTVELGAEGVGGLGDSVQATKVAEEGWKLHLNNSVEDPSYLNEMLGAEVMERAGVVVPRVAHARVRLNGRMLGLYVMKEGFDSRFAARVLGGRSGQVFEPIGGGDVDGEFELKGCRAGKAGGDPRRPFRALVEAMGEADPSTRWNRVRAVCDVERLMSLLVTEILLCHWDGYAMARNNYRLVGSEADGKFTFVATGMDQLLAHPELSWRPQMVGSVASGLMQTPEGRSHYERRFRVLFRELFDGAVLRRRVDEAGALLLGMVSGAERRSLEQGLAELRDRLGRRAESVRRQLSMGEERVVRMDAGQGRLALDADWRAMDAGAESRMGRGLDETGLAYLEVVAQGVTSASWRKRVRLARGSYRFEGRGRLMGWEPLPFGVHQGMRLRVGERSSESIRGLGTTRWSGMEVGFEVSADEADVELICEYRGRGGRGRFDLGSLALMRRDGGVSGDDGGGRCGLK